MIRIHNKNTMRKIGSHAISRGSRLPVLRKLGTVISFTIFLMNAPMSHAYLIGYCEKPEVHSCADDLDGFSDKWDFEACKDELEAFPDKLEEYENCIRRQIDEMISEYEDAVEKYNCKLNREGFCF